MPYRIPQCVFDIFKKFLEELKKFNVDDTAIKIKKLLIYEF